MAERRMFSKTVTDSDMFLELPHSTQVLYFHLAMNADDDGFVNSPLKFLRITGADKEDLENLTDNNLIIAFESGVVVITHWKIHNYIQKDRYNPTIYQQEMSKLKVDENKMYTECIQPVYTSDTQGRLGKDSSDKDSIVVSEAEPQTTTITTFTVPTVDDVKEYCKERNNTIDAENFINYYQANGWMVGKNKMKDWKAAVRTWEKKEKEKKGIKPSGFNNFEQKKTDFEKIRLRERQQLMEMVKTMTHQQS